jgi:hypothetical protein
VYGSQSFALVNTPRQQVADAVNLVIRDAGECVRKPCLWVDTIQLGGFNQGIGDGGGLAASLRSDERLQRIA